MSMIIIFLAMGSPLWMFMISGVVFFYFWMIIAFTYPKTVLIGDGSIAFQLPGSDKIQTFKHNELEFSSKRGIMNLPFPELREGKSSGYQQRTSPPNLKNICKTSSLNENLEPVHCYNG
jgi:hypothetical protein